MDKMIKLIKNANVYAPEHIGMRDILICGNKITRMAETIEGYDMLPDVDVYDARGMIVAPGLIDLHVHVTGGGGEQGPSSRVPEIALSELLLNGVTTCVGMLGTDGTSRSLENLLSKCKALNEEGMTCYMLTGAYQYPSPNLTGSVIRDIMLIDEYRHRMLYERLAIAALVLLQSLCCYIVGLQDQLLTGLVIPWEQFVYILSHDFQTLRYCCKTHISSRYLAAAWKSSSAAAFSMLRFACSTAFST